MTNHVQWLAAVTVSDLSDRAMRIANALALLYVNRETGQCNPSRKTLAERLRISEDTVKRAVRELEAAGWIVRIAGRWRGSPSSVQFVMPSGNVVALAPRAASGHAERGVQTPVKGGQSRTPMQSGKGGKSARERGANLHPPYMNPKGEPLTRESGRDRPAPHRIARVELGSDEQAAWDRWTCSLGLPPLADLAPLHRDGAAWPTTRTPPTDRASFEWTLAERVIRWAADRTPTKPGGRDDRAA